MKGTDADIDFDWSLTPGMEEQVKRIEFWDTVFYLVSCLFSQIYLYAYTEKNTIQTTLHNKHSISVRSKVCYGKYSHATGQK